MDISTSHLEFFDPELPEGTPLAYEIIAPHLHDPVKGLVHVGRPSSLDLAPGVYQVRVRHPRLGQLERMIDVGSEPQLVRFDDSRREQRRRERSRSVPLSGLREHGWVAWWRYRGDLPHPWQPVLDVQMVWHGERLVLPSMGWEFGVALQAGAPGASTILVQVPPCSRHLELKQESDGISARLRTDNAEAESLLDYLEAGYMASAETLRGSMSAEQLLEAKMANPAGAVAGAFFLLRVGEVEGFRPWFRNLASNFPELPDGAVAYAWALLGDPHVDLPALNEARGLLLQAARRGTPVYSEGTRLLFDGLSALAQGGLDPDESIFPEVGAQARIKDPEVGEVLQRLRRRFRNLKRGRVLTTRVCYESDKPAAEEPAQARPPHARALADVRA